MKLTAKVKLVTTKEQAELLTRTLCMANEACNHISGIAWDNQTFAQFRLHGLAYYDTGTAFPALGSQVVVRCEAKVADAYKLDKKVRREFHPLGAIAYDARILTWKMTQSIVSIWTLDGRIKVPFVCGDHQRKLLEGQRGEADLMLIDGTFYLSATCEVEQAELVDVADYLGVDMGIIQIATDSDGESHSGALLKRSAALWATAALVCSAKEPSQPSANFDRSARSLVMLVFDQIYEDGHAIAAGASPSSGHPYSQPLIFHAKDPVGRLTLGSYAWLYRNHASRCSATNASSLR